jgi:hypothetical protein
LRLVPRVVVPKLAQFTVAQRFVSGLLVADIGSQAIGQINLSIVLAGQRVGIKEVDDGIWIVRFMRYDLGYIDLEARTLQPLDNPFGPRLSPMS